MNYLESWKTTYERITRHALDSGGFVQIARHFCSFGSLHDVDPLEPSWVPNWDGTPVVERGADHSFPTHIHIPTRSPGPTTLQVYGWGMEFSGLRGGQQSPTLSALSPKEELRLAARHLTDAVRLGLASKYGWDTSGFSLPTAVGTLLYRLGQRTAAYARYFGADDSRLDESSGEEAVNWFNGIVKSLPVKGENGRLLVYGLCGRGGLLLGNRHCDASTEENRRRLDFVGDPDGLNQHLSLIRHETGQDLNLFDSKMEEWYQYIKHLMSLVVNKSQSSKSQDSFEIYQSLSLYTPEWNRSKLPDPLLAAAIRYCSSAAWKARFAAKFASMRNDVAEIMGTNGVYWGHRGIRDFIVFGPCPVEELDVLLNLAESGGGPEDIFRYEDLQRGGTGKASFRLPSVHTHER